jgi:hypothetical protein
VAQNRVLGRAFVFMANITDYLSSKQLSSLEDAEMHEWLSRRYTFS